MTKRTYSVEERTSALEVYALVGPREASRRLGIGIGTLKGWASRYHVTLTPQGDVEAVTDEIVRVTPEDARDGGDAKEAAVTDGVLANLNVGDAATPALVRNSRARLVSAAQAVALRKARLEETAALVAIEVAERRERLRLKFLEKAEDSLDRMDQPHIDFRGKDADQVTFPRAPADAVRNYATAAAIMLDKHLLLSGETTDRSQSVVTISADVRRRVEQISIQMGIPFDELLSETKAMLGNPFGRADYPARRRRPGS